MIRKIGTAMLLVSVVAIGSVSADEGTRKPLTIGAHGGTLGLGVQAAYDFSDSLAVRGLFSRFDYDFDTTNSDIRYDVEAELESFGLMLDWHPFGGAFRVTGGAFSNGNEISGKAEAGNLEIGRTEYRGRLNATADFKSFAPYLGIGWSSGRADSGFSFVFDLGVLFQDTPDLRADGSVAGAGAQCAFSVSKDSSASLEGNACFALSHLKSDLESEHRDLQDKFDDLDLFPVLSLGLSYRF